MSAPAGSGYAHRTLIVTDGGAFEFRESGAKPTVAFTDEYIRVGCHKVTVAAWKLLNEKYQQFIDKKHEEIVQQGSY